MTTLSPFALAVLLFCALGVPLTGLFVSRFTRVAEYFHAGRRVSLPAFVATLVCTWYGGILAIGEYTWSWGLVNWLALGVFYYVFAAVYALFLAGRVRQSAALSIPEQIGRAHGPLAGRLAALYALLMVSPAPYLLMTAVILGGVTNLPLALTLPLSVLMIVAYVWRGGLRTMILTDFVQFALMFGSFGAALAWLVTHHGGAAFLAARLPATHLAIPGALSWSTIILWGFVALWTLVDPGFHQRVAVARDARTARRGIWISIACWFVFDALTTGCGLYARALLPELARPVEAFPRLAALLPPALQGLFIGGMLATVFSTLDSMCFLSGSTFSRDLLRLRGDERAAIRWGVLATAALGALTAWRLPSVTQMWITFASLGIPVLLPVFASALLRTEDSPAGGMFTRGLLSMLLAALASGGWMVAGFLRGGAWPDYPLGLEPLYPGLVAGVSPLLAGCRRIGQSQKPVSDEVSDTSSDTSSALCREKRTL